MRRRLRVLLVEDALKLRDQFVAQFRGAFEKQGVEIAVDLLDNYSSVGAALESRPHIAVFDNVIAEAGIDRDNVGVAEISARKPRHADTVFVLYTENTFEISQLGIRLPNPDFIVSKTYLLNEEYQAYIGETIACAVHRLPFETLSFVDPKDKLPYKDVTDELRSVIEQCLFGFWDDALEDEALEVRLKPLTGGFSGSSVFQLEFFGVARYENIPFVLKFSNRANVAAEVQRYNAYVRLQLPHDMRVDVIGYGEAGNWAGVCYAFAFGRADGVQTLTKGLQTDPSAAVDRALKRVFQSDLTRWYRVTDLPPVPLADFFANNEEYAPKKDPRRIDGFKRALGEVAKTEGQVASVSGDNFRYDGLECLSLRRSLAKSPSEMVQRCYGHGDLNANNIFVEPSGGNIALIDFEYAGADHCFKDFISFESSVRLEVSETGTALSLLRLVALERTLLQGGSLAADAPAYLTQVARVRVAAAERFGALKLTFATALGMHSLKLLGLPDWSLEQKKRLCAAVLAAALELHDAVNPA